MYFIAAIRWLLRHQIYKIKDRIGPTVNDDLPRLRREDIIIASLPGQMRHLYLISDRPRTLRDYMCICETLFITGCSQTIFNFVFGIIIINMTICCFSALWLYSHHLKVPLWDSFKYSFKLCFTGTKQFHSETTFKDKCAIDQYHGGEVVYIPVIHFQ